jgi:glycosyltransferase involved in cell wall biosynthesis
MQTGSLAGKYVTILYLQYNNPGAYPPVLNSARILRRCGCTVVLFGTIAKHMREMRIPDDVADRIWLLRQPEERVWLKLFFFWFALRGLWTAIRVRPSYLYVSDASACPAAVLIERLLRVKVIYHEHDSPPHLSSEKFRLFLSARRRIASRAAVCILPNRARANELQKCVEGRQKPLVVWNCPSISELPELGAGTRKITEPFIIFYVGSLNWDRVPPTIIDALTQIPAAPLKLVGYETVGSRGFKDKFIAKANDAGISERIAFLGTVSRDKIFDLLRTGHVALCLMPPESTDLNMAQMVGASNKSFDALACGLPLLVTDLFEWYSTFVVRGVAIGCSPLSVESIADALLWFRDHPDEASWMGKHGRRLIEEDWNYEAQFKKVVRALEIQSKYPIDQLSCFEGGSAAIRN